MSFGLAPQTNTRKAHPLKDLTDTVTYFVPPSNPNRRRRAHLTPHCLVELHSSDVRLILSINVPVWIHLCSNLLYKQERNTPDKLEFVPRVTVPLTEGLVTVESSPSVTILGGLEAAHIYNASS